LKPASTSTHLLVPFIANSEFRIAILKQKETESQSKREADEEISKLKERLSGLISSQTSLQKALEEERKQSASNTATIESLRSKLQHQKTISFPLTASCIASPDKVLQMNEANADLHKQVERARESTLQLQTKLSAKEQEISSLHSKHQVAEAERVTQSRSLSQVNRDYQVIKAEVATLTEKLARFGCLSPLFDSSTHSLFVVKCGDRKGSVEKCTAPIPAES